MKVSNTPSSVDVINVISGEVKTNILKRDQGRKLPAGSLYKPLEAEFSGHVDRTPSEFHNGRK